MPQQRAVADGEAGERRFLSLARDVVRSSARACTARTASARASSARRSRGTMPVLGRVVASGLSRRLHLRERRASIGLRRGPSFAVPVRLASSMLQSASTAPSSPAPPRAAADRRHMPRARPPPSEYEMCGTSVKPIRELDAARAAAAAATPLTAPASARSAAAAAEVRRGASARGRRGFGHRAGGARAQRRALQLAERWRDVALPASRSRICARAPGGRQRSSESTLARVDRRRRRRRGGGGGRPSAGAAPPSRAERAIVRLPRAAGLGCAWFALVRLGFFALSRSASTADAVGARAIGPPDGCGAPRGRLGRRRA